MATKITPFLMFEGSAEEAMKFYVNTFNESKIVTVLRYGPGEAGPAGTIKRADFVLCGQKFICIDSYVRHEFSFTPSVSFFVDCDSEAELDRLYHALSDDGKVLMPPDNYGFSKKFCWVNDRFGVSWQLSYG